MPFQRFFYWVNRPSPCQLGKCIAQRLHALCKIRIFPLQHHGSGRWHAVDLAVCPRVVLRVIPIIRPVIDLLAGFQLRDRSIFIQRAQLRYAVNHLLVGQWCIQCIAQLPVRIVPCRHIRHGEVLNPFRQYLHPHLQLWRKGGRGRICIHKIGSHRFFARFLRSVIKSCILLFHRDGPYVCFIGLYHKSCQRFSCQRVPNPFLLCSKL